MDDAGDYVIDIQQATTQLRGSHIVTASVPGAPNAVASVDVVVVSTAVDPHDSHDSVTSSHATHDEAAASRHDEPAADDLATADDGAESTPADEPAHVEVAAETHDAVADATTDQQG